MEKNAEILDRGRTHALPRLRENDLGRITGSARNFRAHDPSHSSQRAAGPRYRGYARVRRGYRCRLLEIVIAPQLRVFAGRRVSASGAGEKGKMIRHLCEIGDFVRRVRLQCTRFGDLSRAPLRLLRLQLCR